jgi:60 kDa SS-A/Ro ribonucleoprotein
VVAALDDAFYASFKNVKPSGGRVLLALDVSGSMGSPIMGSPISCAKASTAMALVTARVEQEYEIFGFSTNFIDLKISPKDTLESAMKKTHGLNFGGTDCAVPMTWAKHQGIRDIDGFVVYTDCETWYGSIHPSQALQSYRRSCGPKAKLAVVGMTGTEFTIADPKDSGQIDFVGFDSSAPQVLSDFIAGRI